MEPQPISRHEFFQTLSRGGLLAGLCGVGIMALHGRKEVSECFNHNYCDSCWAYDGCRLPERKEHRDERSDQIRPA